MVGGSRSPTPPVATRLDCAQRAQIAVKAKILTKADPGFKSGFQSPVVSQSVVKISRVDCKIKADKYPKILYFAMVTLVREVENPESVSRTGLAPKVNNLFGLVSPIIIPSCNEIG